MEQVEAWSKQKHGPERSMDQIHGAEVWSRCMEQKGGLAEARSK
jgi:hypothetical protein